MEDGQRRVESRDDLRWSFIAGTYRPAPDHIVLPRIIIDKLKYCSILQSRIDRGANEHHGWLMGALAEEEIPEGIAAIFDLLKGVSKPNAGMFDRFVLNWRELATDFLPERLADAEGRRKALRRLMLEYHHLKDKVLRRRLDFYRRTAKRIAEKYGRIALAEMDLRRIALLEMPDGDPTPMHPAARRQRTWAAVSELREWIVKQGAKTGAQILEVSGKSHRTCHKCGAGIREGAGTSRTCFACGASFDTDVNAAANLFQGAIMPKKTKPPTRGIGFPTSVSAR